MGCNWQGIQYTAYAYKIAQHSWAYIRILCSRKVWRGECLLNLLFLIKCLANE